MKKPRLTAIACALTLFTLFNGASAAIITSGDLAHGSQDHPQMLAAPPELFPDAALTLSVPGKSVTTEPDEHIDYFTGDAAAKSPRSDSHLGLWLLLLAASILGFLSEIFHRRSGKP